MTEYVESREQALEQGERALLNMIKRGDFSSLEIDESRHRLIWFKPMVDYSEYLDGSREISLRRMYPDIGAKIEALYVKIEDRIEQEKDDEEDC